jgi:hypothetical protein
MNPVYFCSLVPKGLLNHCEGLRSTFPKIGTKFDGRSLFLSLIPRENRHRSCSWLQINACENCPRPPSYVQLGTLTTRHGSSTIYRCFALPQLQYRWQHQSGKLWIPPVGSWVGLMISSQKHWQIAENSSNVLVWLKDMNALSFTLNAVILFLNKIVLR